MDIDPTNKPQVSGNIAADKKLDPLARPEAKLPIADLRSNLMENQRAVSKELDRLTNARTQLEQERAESFTTIGQDEIARNDVSSFLAHEERTLRNLQIRELDRIEAVQSRTQISDQVHAALADALNRQEDLAATRNERLAMCEQVLAQAVDEARNELAREKQQNRSIAQDGPAVLAMQHQQDRMAVAEHALQIVRLEREIAAPKELKVIPRAEVADKTPRDVSQRTVMGGSANAAVGAEHGYEWLHMRALQLSGEQSKANLVAGTGSANTIMMYFENALRGAADAGRKVETEIAVELVPGTDIGTNLKYRAWIDNEKVLDGTLKLQEYAPLAREDVQWWLKGADAFAQAIREAEERHSADARARDKKVTVELELRRPRNDP